MTENNAAQAAQKDWANGVAAAKLAPATGDVVLESATVLEIDALLSKLRAEGVQASDERAALEKWMVVDGDMRDPEGLITYHAAAFREGLAIGRAALASAPLPDVLPEMTTEGGAQYVSMATVQTVLRAARAALQSAAVDAEAEEGDFLVRLFAELDTWRAEDWNELIERRPAILALLRPLVMASAPAADERAAFGRAELSFPLAIPGSRVYLAGPMTGYDDHNFPAFHAAAERLRGFGLEVVNPADHGLVDGLGWADYMRWDLVKLAGCHSVYVLPGWEKSKGASLEVAIAQALGMLVFTVEGAPVKASAPVAGIPVKTHAMHTAVRHVLRTHKLTKGPDGVIEADLIYAVLSGLSAPVAGEAQPVCWIYRTHLESLRDDGADEASVYRGEAGRAIGPDEVPLYAAPQASEADEEDAADAWRRLALQFDGHRMQALAHLRAMLADPQAHAEQTTEFLSAPPLSGDQMLAERIRALSAQPGAQKNDIPAHLLERLRHHAADKANTAFARSTMNELAGYLSPTQPTEQGERDV